VIHIASVSGGKDSAAMSLWLTEQGIEHKRVFADTGWEHPATLEYIDGPLQRKLGPIDVVRSPGGGFAEWCRKKGAFPRRVRRYRWCTSVLKIEPLAAYMAEIDGRIINAVGVRREESQDRAKLPEHDKPRGRVKFDDDTELWRPLIAWTKQDVIDIHRRHGLAPNPLYLWRPEAAERVGCWPCVCSGKKAIRLVADRDPGRIDEIRRLEADVQELARQRYAAKGETFESLGYTPPTMFSKRVSRKEQAQLGLESANLNWPIDVAVAWSRTSHGGRQYDWFFEGEPSCVEWGLCAA
jgi:3'-phosphoadenosine 5'-phosphosulfate sulfotransferase (PAPS reductase)/FAD synthetase